MAFNLRNRSFVKLLDFTPAEIKFLLKLSADLKAAKYGGYEQQRLSGKNVALIFEKSSTRTRTSFEVAAYDQGANVTYLGPAGSHIGHKHRISGVRPSDRRGTSRLCRRAGVEWPDRRVPPHTDPGRCVDHDRAHLQGFT